MANLFDKVLSGKQRIDELEPHEKANKELTRELAAVKKSDAEKAKALSTLRAAPPGWCRDFAIEKAQIKKLQEQLAEKNQTERKT